MPASRPDRAVYSAVHVYYHGAGSETTYAGSYDVGYFQRATPERQAVPTSITVRGEEKITNQSVTGIVTATPGRYLGRFDLDASMKGSPQKQPVRAEVPVIVR